MNPQPRVASVTVNLIKWAIKPDNDIFRTSDTWYQVDYVQHNAVFLVLEYGSNLEKVKIKYWKIWCGWEMGLLWTSKNSYIHFWITKLPAQQASKKTMKKTMATLFCNEPKTELRLLNISNPLTKNNMWTFLIFLIPRFNMNRHHNNRHQSLSVGCVPRKNYYLVAFY